MVDREFIQGINDQLHEKGLTPFDLLTWDALLYLTDRFGDVIFSYQIKELLEQSIKRKAELLDNETNTKFYTGMIR